MLQCQGNAFLKTMGKDRPKVKFLTPLPLSPPPPPPFQIGSYLVYGLIMAEKLKTNQVLIPFGQLFSCYSCLIWAFLDKMDVHLCLNDHTSLTNGPNILILVSVEMY